MKEKYSAQREKASDSPTNKLAATVAQRYALFLLQTRHTVG